MAASLAHPLIMLTTPGMLHMPLQFFIHCPEVLAQQSSACLAASWPEIA